MKSYRMKTSLSEQPKKYFWEHEATFVTVKHLFLQEEIIIASTDTVPGLLAPATIVGYQKLRALKGDRGDKPFLILIAASHLSFFVDMTMLNRGVVALTKKCWPGPLTIVFKARHNLPSFLVSTMGTIALRCPAHEGLQKLLQEIPGIFAPSANRSNIPAPQSLTEVDGKLINEVACVVDHQKENRQATASTIIDVTKVDSDTISDVKKINVLREGAYKKEEIERIYASAYSE